MLLCWLGFSGSCWIVTAILRECVIICVGNAFGILEFVSVRLLPLYYKLGFQKAKFIYMLLGALVGGVTGFLSGSDSTWLTSLHLSITLWICSIVCLVLLPISMRFSVQWMAEKEY